MPKHTIELDDYEVANLRAAIIAAGYGTEDCEACGRPLPYSGEPRRSPLSVLNNGDWIGQIFLKLPHVKHKPNVGADQLADAANKYPRP